MTRDETSDPFGRIDALLAQASESLASLGASPDLPARDSREFRYNASGAARSEPKEFVELELAARHLGPTESTEMTAGTLLTFPQPADGRIRLYCRGVCFAEGELLVEEDRLAVRIIDVFSTPWSDDDSFDSIETGKIF